MKKFLTFLICAAIVIAVVATAFAFLSFRCGRFCYNPFRTKQTATADGKAGSAGTNAAGSKVDEEPVNAPVVKLQLF